VALSSAATPSFPPERCSIRARRSAASACQVAVGCAFAIVARTAENPVSAARRVSVMSFLSGAASRILGAYQGALMTAIIYGIKNCDTMKKARAFLDKNKVAYDFHDYKTRGIDRAKLEGWAKKAGWETLLNRAGTTFRKLPDKDKANVTEKKAIALMLAQPSMIKRPVLELRGGRIIVGFSPDAYKAL
jgi:arsenate reductase